MTNQTVHDPICHMDILIAAAVGSSTHDGKTYYFCSPGCKKDFDGDPAAALEAEATYDHDQPIDHMMGAQPVTMMGMEPSSAGAATGDKKPWWRFW